MVLYPFGVQRNVEFRFPRTNLRLFYRVCEFYNLHGGRREKSIARRDIPLAEEGFERRKNEKEVAADEVGR